MTKFNKIISLAVLLVAGNALVAKSPDSLERRLKVCQYKAETKSRWYSWRNNSLVGTEFDKCIADVISGAEAAAKDSEADLSKLTPVEQAAAHIELLRLKQQAIAKAVADAAEEKAAADREAAIQAEAAQVAADEKAAADKAVATQAEAAK